MDERQGGPGHLLVAAAGLWLVRWLLLRGSYERFGPPGTGETFLIHVICPLRDSEIWHCDVDDWVTKYEPSTVGMCSKHRPQLPRQPLELCPDCARKPGYHFPPKR